MFFNIIFITLSKLINIFIETLFYKISLEVMLFINILKYLIYIYASFKVLVLVKKAKFR